MASAEGDVRVQMSATCHGRAQVREQDQGLFADCACALSCCGGGDNGSETRYVGVD
jgi:hypothetical protein